VVAEIECIKLSVSEVGLELNCAKCKAKSINQDFVDNVRSALPGCHSIDPGNCDILGAAIGSSVVATSLSKRAETLRQSAPRLAAIDHHDALALLRISLGHPKAIYELRAGASFRDPDALSDYDRAMRESIELVLNVQLDNQSWLQSTLPPVLGGIGVRTPSDLALPAFLSSATATLPLASGICGGAPETLINSALNTWQEKAETFDPQGPAHTARAWQRPLDQAKHRRLVSALTTPRDVARLHSTSTPESAALFRGLPSTRDGTRLTNIELPVVVGLRLGIPVAAAGVCRCGAPLDTLGDHALSCNRGVERMRRHDELNSRLRKTLCEAGSQAILEPQGLTLNDGRRLDTVHSFSVL